MKRIHRESRELNHGCIHLGACFSVGYDIRQQRIPSTPPSTSDSVNIQCRQRVRQHPFRQPLYQHPFRQCLRQHRVPLRFRQHPNTFVMLTHPRCVMPMVYRKIRPLLLKIAGRNPRLAHPGKGHLVYGLLRLPCLHHVSMAGNPW